MSRRLLLGLGFLALTIPSLFAQTLSIDHQAVACVVAEKFPRLEARFAPAETVATARVVFQPVSGPHWYSVAMKSEGPAFSGVLPKPRKSLKAYHYYIEVSDKTLSTSRTEEYTTNVAAGPAACRGKITAVALGSASVLLQVPAGAAVVPIGFASTGVVAAGSGSAAAAAGASAGGGGGLSTAAVVGIVAGAGAAAGGVAVAASSGGGDNKGGVTPVTPVTVPPITDDLRFSSSNPPPGSTISVGGGASVLRVTATVLYHETGTYLLFATTGDPAHCAAGGGLIDVVANQPQTITVALDYPARFANAPPPCPLPFTSSIIGLQLAIPNTQDAAGVRIPMRQFPISYSFTP